jgi:hypothetical protein
VQGVEPVGLAPVDRDDQVAAPHARRLGGRALADAADEQAVALGQADRAAHLPGDVRRRQREAQPARLGGLAAAEAVERVGGDGHGDDQPAVEAHGVEAEQPSARVDQRAAGGAAGQRGGVLDRAGQAPAARPAQAPLGGGDEAQGCAQPAPAGVGERDDRRAEPRAIALGEPDLRGVAGVDVEHGEPGVAVDARDGRVGAAAVGEDDGGLAAAQRVRDGGDPPGRDDDA